MRPATNATRHAASPPTGRINPPRMPLIPATRPASTANIRAARPMSRPPARAAYGVKLCQSMRMRTVYIFIDY